MAKLWGVVVALAAVLSLAGCSTPAGPGEVERLNVPHDGVPEAEGHLVFRSANAWQEFWGRHFNGTRPEPQRPVIDFAKSYVVAIFARQQPSPCYEFIVHHRVDAGSIRFAPEMRPSEDELCAAVVSQPSAYFQVSDTRLEPHVEPIRYP